MQIIKNILKDNNLNQVQLCNELKISPALLSAIMHQNRNISIALAHKIHSKYKIDFKELLDRSNANEK
jgi:transcriptional regulator with XRE-family HTH domain